MINIFSKNKSISRVVIFNVCGSFILRGISLFSTPIFTRLLTPADYGIVAVYMAWLSIFSLFIGLQSHGSIANAKIKYDKFQINAYFSSVMTLAMLSFFFVLLICVLLNRYIAELLEIENKLLIILIIHSFSSFIVSFYTVKWMQFKEVEKNILFSLIISISTILLSALLVSYSNKNKYLGKIYGSAIPQVISAVVFLFLLYKKGRCFYNKHYWKYCLNLTLPLILHGAAGMILSQSDRIMLKKIIGEEAVGIYSVGYSLALVIDLIWGAFNTSWLPYYYEDKKQKKITAILDRSNNYLFVFSSLTMGFILLAPEVFKLLAPAVYWNGIKIIPFIALAYYFNFLYSFPANHEFFNEKTIFISIGTLCAAVINIIFNFLLIPSYGIVGASIATLIGYIFSFMLHDVIARFIVKDFEYRFVFYVKGIVPILCITALYYATLKIWFLRWGIGGFIGVYLIIRIIRKRSLF